MIVPGNLGVVVHGRGDLRVEELPEPRPADDEAVVGIAFGGICGSDLHYWRDGAVGESVLRAPMVLGHEVSGTVLTAAADGSGPVAGTGVAVHPATPGAGRFPAGRSNISPGATYLGSAATFPHRDGAFARRVALPTRMLRAIPGGLALDLAALAEPAAVAAHAIARAGARPGMSAAVVGCGPIGALAVAGLRRAGLQVTVVDVRDEPLRLGQRMGAARALRADDPAVLAVDADVVFEASGSPRGLGSAIACAARGARIVLVGMQPSGEHLAALAAVVTRELELVGSFRFVDEIDGVISALAGGDLDLSGVIAGRYGLGQVLDAFERAGDPGSPGKVLLDFTAD